MLSQVSEILAEGRGYFPIKGCEFTTSSLGPHGTIIWAKVTVGEQVFTGSRSVLTVNSEAPVLNDSEGEELALRMFNLLKLNEGQALLDALENAGVMKSGSYILPVKTTETSITQKEVPVEDLNETPGGECADCGKDIFGYWAGTLRISGVKVAELTENRHGRPLCANCSRKVIKSKVVKS
jgi:hypothetical protein